MSRPRLDIGTFGAFTYQTTPSGDVRARTYFRDWDGSRRLVQATGNTKATAERSLRRSLTIRAQRRTPVDTTLTPDSSFTDLVKYWLEDMELEDRLSPLSREKYASQMRQLVVPVFGNLTLREIGVARCDTLLKQLSRLSYSRARQAKVVLRQAFGLAVRHEVLARNPVDGVARLHRPPHTPDVFTADEVRAIRLAVKLWEGGIVPSGPKPDGQLSAIIEVMLGSSARIGEVLALRRMDVDVTGPRPSVYIRGTITTLSGVPPYRQDHPKTAKSRRMVTVPSFTADAIRLRLAKVANVSPEALVFCTRNGTPLTMHNVRRQLRHVMELAGIEGVTPHKFRRTVATAINNSADVELAAELLGHTSSKITIQHYIQRNEMVNPVTADLLDAAFAPKH